MRYPLVPTLALCAATAVHAADSPTAHDHAPAEQPRQSTQTVGHEHHDDPKLRLIDLSLAVVGVAGISTATDAELETLNAGGHDPHRRGFTLQTAELSLAGAVDPYFIAEAHLAASPDHGIELEEAFITTTSLPYDLEAKAGYQLIEFGQVNTTHTHAWGWIEQPVIASRLLGGEGSRTPGARLACLLPTAWFSQVFAGAYNADDASMISFEGEAGHEHEEEAERTIGGRLREEELTTGSAADLAYLLRWENGGAVGSTEVKLGLSWLTGPNASGVGARSDLYGADLVVATKPSSGPFTSITAVVEMMYRSAEVPETAETGEDEIDPADDFIAPADTLTDWGLYAQVELGLAKRWSVGLRGEYATASGDSVDHDGMIDHDEDAMRDTRIRISPLIAVRPSEFSRLRLQYDFDKAEHLEDGTAHSVWLGLDVLLGAHPAHDF